MSLSLRDQLLQAGLVTEQQAKEAERRSQQQQHSQHRLPKQQRQAPPQQPTAAQRAEAAKQVRDQELNRKQQEKADRKARWSQIKQIVEAQRLPRVETEELYSFVDGTKIRRVPVDAALRDGLSRGTIGIIRHDGRYEFVPDAAVEQIRERDARAVMNTRSATDAMAGTASVADDDPYKDFAVPDDLTW